MVGYKRHLTLEGRVLTKDGKTPAAGVTVYPMPPGRFTVTTDADGRFVVPEIELFEDTATIRYRETPTVELKQSTRLENRELQVVFIRDGAYAGRKYVPVDTQSKVQRIEVELEFE